MIVLDIETSGLIEDCGIWQIGSIDLESGREFLEEARIDDNDIIMDGAMKVTGKTERDFRDKNKQSQRQLILNYLNWRSNFENKLNLGQNVVWDSNMIEKRCRQYGILDKFGKVMNKRSIDLHTLAQEKYFELKKEYFLDKEGKSKMNLRNILKFCGMQDNRQAHNALEDCKLEGECYYRLKYRKNLFPEYAKFEIPEELRK